VYLSVIATTHPRRPTLLNLRQFAPGLFKGQQSDESVEADELSPFEYHQRHAPKHGPSRARWLTSGQMRRMHERSAAAQRRKTNKRFRKQWVENEQAFFRLHGQVQLLDNRPTSPLVPGVERVLTQRYGSVEAAREHLDGLLRERRGEGTRVGA
jgi:hypothetical protein